MRWVVHPARALTRHLLAWSVVATAARGVRGCARPAGSLAAAFAATTAAALPPASATLAAASSTTLATTTATTALAHVRFLSGEALLLRFFWKTMPCRVLFVRAQRSG